MSLWVKRVLQKSVNIEEVSIDVQKITTGKNVFRKLINEKKEKFLATLAFDDLSAAELEISSATLNLELGGIKPREHTIEFECTRKAAHTLARRMGGVLKIALICGDTLEEVFDRLPLPDEPKFQWSISAYGCPEELVEETRTRVRELLKENRLGKANFLAPNVQGVLDDEQAGGETYSELALKDLDTRIFSRDRLRPSGFEIMVRKEKGESGHVSYGYTIELSDLKGFEERDLLRPYKDPTITMGPRIARTLVNLSVGPMSKTILDPFCGLGTILQEALICGYSAVGLDISRSNVERTRTNVAWLVSHYEIRKTASARVLRRDATELEKGDLPPVDSVATEPILLEKFTRNPDFSTANEFVRKSMGVYSKTLVALSHILRKGSRIAVVAPEIVDDRGRPHALKLDEVDSFGLRLFHPRSEQTRIQYPLRIHTAKKKIVKRNVYVMEVS